MEHDISWIMGCSIIYILVAGGNSYHENFTLQSPKNNFLFSAITPKVPDTL